MDTPYQVWFILDNFLINQKLVLNFVIRKILKFPYENQTFLQGKL